MLIDARPKEFNFKYSKTAGMFASLYRLQNDPPYMPPVDLTGVIAEGKFYDKCGGTFLNAFGSETGELVPIVSDFNAGREDPETGIVTVYPITGGQGFRFDLTAAKLAAYTWLDAYYEINLIYPTSEIELFARGVFTNCDC